MSAGLTVALALLAQAAAADAPVYGPEAPPAKAAPPAPPTEPRDCEQQHPDPNSNSIVICAVRPQGYRLPPDVVEARRLKKQGDAGRPHNPHETYADHSCATVGPMGCRGTPTINLIAVAATAAEISQRLAKGQEIGSLFETEPQSSEYQLYLQAKREREAKEAAARAKVVKDAAVQAAQQSDASTPPPQQAPAMPPR